MQTHKASLTPFMVDKCVAETPVVRMKTLKKYHKNDVKMQEMPLEINKICKISWGNTPRSLQVCAFGAKKILLIFFKKGLECLMYTQF